jgi:hypothetical protein
VLAVADGTVVAVLDTLDDQAPGTLPDVKSMSLGTVDGNNVVLVLGGGVFAVNAHLEHKSITVSVGDRVKRGQLLGKLETSAVPRRPICISNSGEPVGSWRRRFALCYRLLRVRKERFLQSDSGIVPL